MEWHRTKEILPPDQVAVLVYCPALPFKGIFQAQLFPSNNGSYIFYLIDRSRKLLPKDVTHWMESPPTPTA